MSTGTVFSALVPVEQTDATPPRDVAPDQLGSHLHGRFVRLPAGWLLVRAYQLTLSIGFADLDDPAARGLPPIPALLEGGGGDSAIPIAARTTVPATYVFFARESESLEVEFSHVADPLARVWANWILEQDKGLAPRFSLQQVPLGRGFAGGPAFVIDAGDQLIRGSYDDGKAGPGLGDEEPAARVGALQERALKLMHELVR